MTDETRTTPHEASSATTSSRIDEELSSLLGRANAEPEYDVVAVSLEADCFPLDGVVDAVNATARARSQALRTRSAGLARGVLARAEQEVRDVVAQQLPAADETERSRDIVARAQREVSEILAQGRNDAEVVELRAGLRAADLRAQADSLTEIRGDVDASDRVVALAITHPDPDFWRQAEPVTPPGANWVRPKGLPVDLPRVQPERLQARVAGDVFISAHAILEEGPNTAAPDQYFATLRASAMPSEDGELRYQVSGRLTLATMLAFQQAVSRLPGVNAARVEPMSNDVAVLNITTNDSTLVRGLLGSMAGVHLQIDPV